jgi:hypothetical protein
MFPLFIKQTNPPKSWQLQHAETCEGFIDLTKVYKFYAKDFWNGYGGKYPALYFETVQDRATIWLYLTEEARDKEIDLILNVVFNPKP